MISNKF